MPSRRGFFRTFAVAPLVAASAKAAPAAAPVPLSAAPPWPDDSDPQFWDRIRDQFYIKPGEAYFNTGTIGATPRPVLERVIEDMRTLQATITRWDWSPNMPNWISGYSPEVALRAKLAKLVNADASEIALIQNATMGMNFLAHGLDLKAGDEIISTNQEHPSGVCGWLIATTIAPCSRATATACKRLRIRPTYEIARTTSRRVIVAAEMSCRWASK